MITNRQVSILAVVAVGMAIVTVVLYSGVAPRSEFTPGANLIQGLAPEKFHQILIESSGSSVTLKREGKEFVIAERRNYPASTKEVNDMLIKCLDIHCAEKVTDSPKNHAELNVADDSEDGVKTRFLDASGETLIGFIKGKSAERGSGSYVRLLGEDTVYASEKYFYLDSRPTDYIEKEVVKVKKDDVARVDVKTSEGAYTVAHDEDGAIALLTIPEGKQAKGTNYEDVFDALSGLRIDDVERPGDSKIEWDATFMCRLKTGLVYTLESGKKKDGDDVIKLAARADEGDKVTIALNESDESLKEKADVLEAADKAAAFNTRHKGWIYSLSSWNAGKVRKHISDLIEDKPEEKKEEEEKKESEEEGEEKKEVQKAEPEEITASHILIGYKGADRSEATRTKEEAKKLAEEILKKAKAEGADFAELAKKHSEGPSKDEGGDLGKFGKGAMAKPFEEAAFALEVGAISGVVETPFGFHVIKRTE